MKIKYAIFLLSALSLFASCGRGSGQNLAAGTFETTEVLVSSENTGRILSIKAEEGSTVRAGQELCRIDSTQLELRRSQLTASLGALEARKTDLTVQTAALRQQLETLRIEKARVENLLKANAANEKMLDDVNAQTALLEKQLAAQTSSILSGNASLESEIRSLEFQIRQLEDQIDRSRLTSPLDGTVLVKYAESGELAVPGKALMKIGDMSSMIFRAYLTADQLAELAVGQEVTVAADFGTSGDREYPGTVSWISSESEFTPKTIQTKDERANLVYAVKVRVPGDGFLKIGMYGNLRLKGARNDSGR